MNSTGPWSMRDELAFIDNIGFWRGPVEMTAHQKVELLQGYRRGLELRKQWVNLDREQLLQHVDKLISHYSAINPTIVI